MIKRISVLIRKDLRSWLNNLKPWDREKVHGFNAAMAFVNEVTHSCLIEGFLPEELISDEKLRSTLGNGHSRNDDLLEVFRRSSRIQVVLQIGSHAATIECILKFFEAGKKEYCYKLDIQFLKESGEVAAINAFVVPK